MLPEVSAVVASHDIPCMTTVTDSGERALVSAWAIVCRGAADTLDTLAVEKS